MGKICLNGSFSRSYTGACRTHASQFPSIASKSRSQQSCLRFKNLSTNRCSARLAHHGSAVEVLRVHGEDARPLHRVKCVATRAPKDHENGWSAEEGQRQEELRIPPPHYRMMRPRGMELGGRSCGGLVLSPRENWGGPGQRTRPGASPTAKQPSFSWYRGGRDHGRFPGSADTRQFAPGP